MAWIPKWQPSLSPFTSAADADLWAEVREGARAAGGRGRSAAPAVAPLARTFPSAARAAPHRRARATAAPRGAQPIAAGGGGANPGARRGRRGVQTRRRRAEELLWGGGGSVPIRLPVPSGALSEYCPSTCQSGPVTAPFARARLLRPWGTFRARCYCPGRRKTRPGWSRPVPLARCGGARDLPRLSAGARPVPAERGSCGEGRSDEAWARVCPGARPGATPERRGLRKKEGKKAPRCAVQYPFNKQIIVTVGQQRRSLSFQSYLLTSENQEWKVYI